LATLTVPAGAADPDPSAPPPDDATVVAKEALAEVQDLFEGLEPLGTDTEQDLTLALRDLALLKNDLPPAQEREAERLLARPTDGGSDQFGDGYTTAEATPVCSDVVCVHYVTTTGDRVPTADGTGNGVPDYVDFTLATMTDVHNKYVAAGYRAPKSDLSADNNGGDARPDVYLADIGPDGFYGYCATDEDIPTNGPQDTWGYCVLDNDYAQDEFPTNTPKENLQVTAAHEYFHAVQFGYDVGEDGWVMEATATWAEDELYDGVDDNVQYLRSGPMRLPHESLDQYFGAYHYGAWIFFRYLTEKFPASQAGMPTLVRELWRRLDDAPGGADDYSLEGVKKTLQKRDLSLAEAFARFSAANRTPGRSYDEGKENRYPTAPLDRASRLSQGARSTSLRLWLDHLAAGTVRYTPAASLVSPAWRLRLVLDMADRWKGTGAAVTIQPRNAAPRTQWVKLDKDGDARPTYNFSTKKVKYVEVTLVNASDDFRCNRGTRFSCEGKPKFDNSSQRISAKLFKAS
ncbi:MAG TPA: MXAN_6640 family putative metalloprotease, partial [Nocardioides sp.]|nr:MXAN_6640 family putative metalloprotease [Nocardioides sp.]